MGILQTSKRANSIVRGNRQYRIASFFLTNNNLKLDTWQMMRNIKSMRDRISLILKCEFFLALFGVMLAVYVDQSCWIGYVPTPEEEARGIPNPLANTTSLPECRSRRVGVELAKSAVTISTLLLILFIVYYNVMYVRLSEAKLFYFHTRRGSFDPYQFVLVKRKGIRQIQALRFLVELIICLPHCLPGFTMRIDIEMLGRVAVYRFESLIVIWMFFRLYIAYLMVRRWLFMHYFEEAAFNLGDEATLQMIFNPANKIGGKLALKVALKKHPLRFIGGMAIVSIFVMAYCTRVAEGCANQIQSNYFWNQLWMVMVTMSTTGYGDMYPVTHAGRFVSIFAMVAGFLFTAIFTASATRAFDLNDNEAELVRIMSIEAMRCRLVIASARRIQVFVRIKSKRLKGEAATKKLADSRKNLKNAFTQYRRFRAEHPHLFLAHNTSTRSVAPPGNMVTPPENEDSRAEKDALGQQCPVQAHSESGSVPFSEIRRIIQEEIEKNMVKDRSSTPHHGYGKDDRCQPHANMAVDFLAWERRFKDLEAQVGTLCQNVENLLESVTAVQSGSCACHPSRNEKQEADKHKDKLVAKEKMHKSATEGHDSRSISSERSEAEQSHSSRPPRSKSKEIEWSNFVLERQMRDQRRSQDSKDVKAAHGTTPRHGRRSSRKSVSDSLKGKETSEVANGKSKYMPRRTSSDPSQTEEKASGVGDIRPIKRRQSAHSQEGSFKFLHSPQDVDLHADSPQEERRGSIKNRWRMAVREGFEVGQSETVISHQVQGLETVSFPKSIAQQRAYNGNEQRGRASAAI